ncbi:MAG: hypothetical protein AB1657_03125 [Candidatus Micrarchaeota archaeon]
MFEGLQKCAICNAELSHGEGQKHVDLHGFTHAFCGRCVQDTHQVKLKLGLKL